MIYNRKFVQIMKIKNSRSLEYKALNINYCTKVLNQVIKNKKVYDMNSVFELEKDLQGVYLIFALDSQNNLKMSYIGESTDIQTRWKKHLYHLKNKNRPAARLRKLESNISNLRFVILALTDSQNQRLKTETYYIYTFKSRFISANSKIANNKMRCNFGHGVKKTFLTYSEIDGKFRLEIYGCCWNKMCQDRFLIDKEN
ncbi:hypothetical protein SCLARK_00312 [Spiroplasma clarkii]|uniref:GIY-YIG domain-containing protein n=1 Tax=Spiroplasma clarkii TaxID=2139 RepID=A0A1Y0KZA8_9MOLU|nr:GIY-YIG nuclease family protein [Spiroplasma clarkii]ARU91067.1 hypothetical protein SCLARK_00312 [Spiroplasma clarkii]ATX70504.1 hypothetical protein SCLAR_v1c01730 [Spiroplasma clarkii]